VAEILYRKLFGARPRAAVDFSGRHIQNRSGWTWSLWRISVLLATCSMSGLATCITLTGFSLSCFAVSTESAAAAASAYEEGFERDEICCPPQAYEVAAFGSGSTLSDDSSNSNRSRSGSKVMIDSFFLVFKCHCFNLVAAADVPSLRRSVPRLKALGDVCLF